MPFVQTPNHHIHYQTIGSGPPIILLHGIFGIGNDWKRYGYAGLLDRYQLILVDLLGHGRSSKSSKIAEYDPIRQAKDIKAIVDQLQLQQVIVWGYSYGARIAFAFAISYPDWVRLLLVGGMHPYPVKNVYDQIKKRMSIIESGMTAWVEYLLDNNILLDKKERSVLLQNDPKALITIDKSILAWKGFGNRLEMLNDPEFEIIIYLGSKDRSYIDLVTKYSKTNPTVRVHVIDQLNHFSAFKESGVVVDSLQKNFEILNHEM